MTDETTYGRETVVIVELEQPRCANRFGTLPCTATGTPKCYNTYWTCLDRQNYDPSGSLVWRFARPQDTVDWLYEATTANDIKANALPFLVSASTFSSKINVAAARRGESPLGVNATAKVVLENPPWDDHVGDFYLADRASVPNAPFWALWAARNPLYPNMILRIYEGYVGQPLSAMQVRVFDLENVDGPSSNNQWTLTGRDPLDKARGDNAKFPPTSNIELAANISDTTASIPVTCVASELDLTLGNVSERYAIIGDEIVRYSGYTGTEPNLTLTGVARGQLGTVADGHSAEDAIQRVARYEQYEMYKIARDLLQDFANIPAAYIPFADWTTEGNTFLSTLKATTTITQPEPVEDLVGELCRDGMFSIWWDDRAQEIRLLAVKPPQGTPTAWTDGDNILLNSFQKKTVTEDRMTRISIYFGQRDPTQGLEDGANYRNRRVYIDAEVESENGSGGQVVENVIHSRWINTFSNALLVGATMALRYRLPPQYVTLDVDAKDRSINMGDVVDVISRNVVDVEGNEVSTRWQVIQLDEVKSGETLRATLQSYQYVGKFAIIMANDAPLYADATETERETGCWIAENTGLMPDGTDAYLFQ